jgi:hypothetical protein
VYVLLAAHPPWIPAVLQGVLRTCRSDRKEDSEVKNLKKAAAVTMVAGGLLAAGTGMASAHSAHADGKAVGSPGVISGNVIQAPVHVPVNVVGNTVNVIGALNPAFGNLGLNH